MVVFPRGRVIDCATVIGLRACAARATVNATREAERNLCAEAAQRGSPGTRAGGLCRSEPDSAFAPMYTIGQGRCRPPTLSATFRLLATVQGAVGRSPGLQGRPGRPGVRDEAATGGTDTRPTVPDRSLEPVSSTRRQPSSREIERPEST